MHIATNLGLSVEDFCRMCLKTKMLLSNVIGHAAELQYEKYLNNKQTKFTKAEVDVHYDYIVHGKREQVKRYEVASTNLNRVGVNLTQTHGDRSAQDAFYKVGAFDRLIICDLSLKQFFSRDFDQLPRHPEYPNHLKGRFTIERQFKSDDPFDYDFFKTMQHKNEFFPSAIEELREKYSLDYSNLLEKVCNLNLDEIDSLFSHENFRLITGAKGFAAEEHFNNFLENHGVNYYQDTNMYSKVDHWIGPTRIQVKFPNLRGCDETHWAVKTHKSHGSGKGELYTADVFDVLALFIGFEMDPTHDKYIPKSVRNEWLFIHIDDLEKHHEHQDCLKRVPKIQKSAYTINDIDYLRSIISDN